MVYMALKLNLQRDLDKLLQWEQFWKMILHYSSDGLTNDVYACSLTKVEPMFRLRRRKPRVLLALPQMLLMWLYGRWLSTQINVTCLPSHVIKHL
jgi:hypothetical protein